MEEVVELKRIKSKSKKKGKRPLSQPRPTYILSPPYVSPIGSPHQLRPNENSQETVRRIMGAQHLKKKPSQHANRITIPELLINKDCQPKIIRNP